MAGLFSGWLNGLLIALVVFAALDYTTGVMCAIADKSLSSAVGFKGVAHKSRPKSRGCTDS